MILIPDEAIEAATTTFPRQAADYLDSDTVRVALQAAAPFIAAAAWADGHESGFWNGRESAGSGEMKLCGVEHAEARNPYKQ